MSDFPESLVDAAASGLDACACYPDQYLYDARAATIAVLRALAAWQREFGEPLDLDTLTEWADELEGEGQ